MQEKTRAEKIAEVLDNLGCPKYRLAQVYEAIYKKGFREYSAISTLPMAVRNRLRAELGEVLVLKNIHETKSRQALKILFETKDGYRIETVRMLFNPTEERPEEHESLCISSQCGCALGCSFCATGKIGFRKNLTPDEIADQVLYFRQIGDTIGSISLMGMGEPFANPHLFDALEILTSPKLMGISPRRLSVSTIGIVPGIQRLIKEYPNVNLSFSLHSPFPDQREKLMPIARTYPTDQVMKAVDQYVEKTNHKAFIAYILLKNENDSAEHAQALASLIKERGRKSYLYHVSLVRFNPGPAASQYEKPTLEAISKFRTILDRNGIKNTLRQCFGVEVKAACGQLYAAYARQ